MKSYSYKFFICFILINSALYQCSNAPIDPSLLALSEVIEQYQTKTTISKSLIPFDQSPIPSSEQFRKNKESNIDILLETKHKHLPESIRIPDPVIRELVNKKVLNKTELESLFTQLSTHTHGLEILSDKKIDFNQSFHVLDSLGYKTVESYTQPILINDKLILGKIITDGITQYQTVKPLQSTILTVYQSQYSDESESVKTWKEIYQKKLR